MIETSSGSSYDSDNFAKYNTPKLMESNNPMVRFVIFAKMKQMINSYRSQKLDLVDKRLLRGVFIKKIKEFEEDYQDKIQNKSLLDRLKEAMIDNYNLPDNGGDKEVTNNSNDEFDEDFSRKINMMNRDLDKNNPFRYETTKLALEELKDDLFAKKKKKSKPKPARFKDLTPSTQQNLKEQTSPEKSEVKKKSSRKKKEKEKDKEEERFSMELKNGEKILNKYDKES